MAQKDGKISDSETLSPGLIPSLPALPTERVGRLSRNSTILSPPQILTHSKYKYKFIQLEIETHICTMNTFCFIYYSLCQTNHKTT